MLFLLGSTAFPSPKRAFPVLENPRLEKPELGFPKLVSPELENPAQLNTYIFNQILKTTATVLIKEPSVKSERKAALRQVMLFFSEVGVLEPSAIRWNTLRYQRSNRNYEMLINICYFVLDGMLQTTEHASVIQMRKITVSDSFGSGDFQLVGKYPNPSNTANSLQAAHPPDALAFHDLPSLKQ